MKKIIGAAVWSLFVIFGITRPTDHLITVANNQTLRAACSSFIDNVLRQTPAKTLWAHVDNASQKNPKILQSDADLYKACLKDIAPLTPSFSAVQKIKALQFQKRVIADQIRELLGANQIIEGILEIGNPGTYTSTIMPFYQIQGPIYALTDTTGISDYIKAFSTSRPLNYFIAYDQRLPLNDYAPITSQTISDNSIDLALCTIGLHHIPQEKLDEFVASLARIIRPGGRFILRDHDIINDDIMHLAHAAHTLFNLLMLNLPLEEELREYRNFQPLSYWIELLKKHGFELTKENQLLQAGDPTLNTLLMFTRVAKTKDEQKQAVERELKNNDPNYLRSGIQTYLTSVEWFDVDASQDYGQFINHTPFYEYPWFATAKTYASLFEKSWNAAAQKNGHLAVLCSPYTQMNTFIMISKIIECGAKGIVSYPIHKLFSGEEPGTLKALIRDEHNQFATLDPDIIVVKDYKNCIDYNLKLIELPRYKKLFNILLAAKEHSEKYSLVTIAGQTEIQVKVRKNNDNHCELNGDGCTILYDWILPSQQQTTYYALNVKVDMLLTTLKRLSNSGIEIMYVHDF